MKGKTGGWEFQSGLCLKSWRICSSWSARMKWRVEARYSILFSHKLNTAKQHPEMQVRFFHLQFCPNPHWTRTRKFCLGPLWTLPFATVGSTGLHPVWIGPDCCAEDILLTQVLSLPLNSEFPHTSLKENLCDVFQIRTRQTSNWEESAARLIETQENAAKAAQHAYHQLALVRGYLKFTSGAVSRVKCCNF